MIAKPQAAEVTLPSDAVVRVVRSFHAPRELVYRAYTTPDLMKRWLLGPPGWSMPVCEMDVRVDGTFRWRWRSDEDGSEFGFHGTFLEVDAPARLRNTEFYDPGDIGGDMGQDEGPALVTVSLDERDGVTTLTTDIEYPSRKSRDAALSTGMTDGMELSYQNLDALLASEVGSAS